MLSDLFPLFSLWCLGPWMNCTLDKKRLLHPGMMYLFVIIYISSVREVFSSKGSTLTYEKQNEWPVDNSHCIAFVVEFALPY